ncbi:MAG: FAD:protein FMN transferase [Thermoleophilia bacterium]|nr:FAD:protein FMN transferase [Thermoleophilia bacterium]
MRTRSFRAMGTEVELLVDAAGTVADVAMGAAETEVRRLEEALSRFDPRSELSRLNRLGRLVPGPDLFRVVHAALDARDRTGGRFDPTVLPAVRAAGYDRDLGEVRDADPGPAGPPVPGGGGVRFDTRTGEIVLGPGVQLDLGGIAKGDAADRAVRILAQAGPAVAVVGGDVAVSGPRRGGGGWPIAVDGTGLVLSIASGGLATSGTDRRRWTRGGVPQHHVIDPATGAPACTDLVRVTASAPSATEAEALATELLLRGSSDGGRRAGELGVAAVLTTAVGTVLAGVLA